MRKMVVAFIILALILSGAFWERKQIENICAEMKTRLNIIEEGIKTQSDMAQTVEDFDALWHKREKTLDFLTPHDETDEININIVRLKGHLDVKEEHAALLIVREMKERFSEIGKKTRISYTNIF